MASCRAMYSSAIPPRGEVAHDAVAPDLAAVRSLRSDSSCGLPIRPGYVPAPAVDFDGRRPATANGRAPCTSRSRATRPLDGHLVDGALRLPDDLDRRSPSRCWSGRLGDHAGVAPRPPRAAGRGYASRQQARATRRSRSRSGSTLFVAVDVVLATAGGPRALEHVLALPRRRSRAPSGSRSRPGSGPWTFRTAGPDGQFGTPRRRRHPERAARSGGTARVPQASLEGCRALALPAELPHQAGRHPGHHHPPVVPGARRRAGTRSAARSTAA